MGFRKLIQLLGVTLALFGSSPARAQTLVPVSAFKQKLFDILDTVDFLLSKRIGDKQFDFPENADHLRTILPGVAARVVLDTKKASIPRINPTTHEVEIVDRYLFRIFLEPEAEFWYPIFPWLSAGARVGIVLSRTYLWSDIHPLNQARRFSYPMAIFPAIKKLPQYISDSGHLSGEVGVQDSFAFVKSGSVQAGVRFSLGIGPSIVLGMAEEFENHDFTVRSRSLSWNPSGTTYTEERSSGVANTQGFGFDFLGRDWIEFTTSTEGKFDQQASETARLSDEKTACAIRALSHSGVTCSTRAGNSGTWAEKRSGALFGTFAAQSVRETETDGTQYDYKKRKNKMKGDTARISFKINTDETAIGKIEIESKKLKDKWLDLLPSTLTAKPIGGCILDNYGIKKDLLQLEFEMKNSEAALFLKGRAPTLGKIKHFISESVIPNQAVRVTYTAIDDAEPTHCRKIYQFVPENLSPDDSLRLKHLGNASIYFPFLNTNMDF